MAIFLNLRIECVGVACRRHIALLMANAIALSLPKKYRFAKCDSLINEKCVVVAYHRHIAPY
ncbi:hypothetical protein ACE1CD_33940 [Aerosakkonema sp. BLCC-F183]|uniref:hypothetical protein n=1 Tax=Aerosakkonema sp. BLCC-F183 TaxID=3342834 RepID=UPI0035B94F39